MSDVIIHAKYDELVDPNKLIPNSKNPNIHPATQIVRLASIIQTQGFRRPITVSKQSGCITVGHGRRLAALHLGMPQVPVVYQDYASPDLEYADLVADNAVADWAELDLSSINLEIPELGPDFDIDLLGVEGFKMDPSDLLDEPNIDELSGDLNKKMKFYTCPNCEKEFEEKQAQVRVV